MDKLDSLPAGQEGLADISFDDSWPSIRRALTSTDLVWRCAGCGYQRQQRVRPAGCPDCGADSEEFVGRTSLEWRLSTPEAPPDPVA